MSLKSALIFRRFLSNCCLHYHQIRCFSAYPRFDFSRIVEPDDAIDEFRNMLRMHPPPSVIDFTKLLSVVVKMQKYSLALHMFDKMLQRNALVNDYTFNIAIDCFCRLERPDFGFAILGSFFKRGYKPDVVTFTTLIKGLLLVRRIPEAAKLCWRLSAEQLCNPDERTYSVMINGLCKAGGIHEALELLSRLEKGNCKLDVYAYNIVIDGLCKNRKVDDALQLFSTLGDKGISPDVVTYNSIIEGLCNHSRGKEAEDMLRKMISIKVFPDVVTCSIFVDALCREGRMEEAEHMLVKMRQIDVQPNIVTYNALINGYCLQGEMDKARNIFQLAVKSGIKSDVTSYSSLMNGYCKMGRIDEVCHLFTMIRAKGLKRNVVSYSIMLEALFHDGQCEEGLKLFKEMEALQVYPNTTTYGILLHEGRIGEAKDLMVQMVIKGCLPDSVTYNIYVQALLRRSKMDDVILVLKEMTARGGCPLGATTFEMLIEPLRREGKDSVLFDLVKKLLPKKL
ncbi:pentatricopeptide repeat-containing protein At1g62910-like isoform X2 [Salvia hispanica]|uniref:pentatricopeptide repeat-containing protein At1g62910-like isoform X2 n=1 Tax=Salvia hispanica TaxID=49212 RepID=UPI00200901B0|nr:pentatricopeptide repeat-containing protein At1g62910-like isoform X2 [Salvia hispanica]